MKLSTDIKPRRKGDLSEIYADVTKLKKKNIGVQNLTYMTWLKILGFMQRRNIKKQ